MYNQTNRYPLRNTRKPMKSSVKYELQYNTIGRNARKRLEGKTIIAYETPGHVYRRTYACLVFVNDVESVIAIRNKIHTKRREKENECV